jgi:hypothetical protein
MKRVLIVANRTLAGEHLMDEVRRQLSEGDCEFHVVVPATHPGGGTWTEGGAQAAARQRLDEVIPRLEELGCKVTGEIGDPNPVLAVNDCVIANRYDEMIVSTLPKGASSWLHADAVHRLRRRFPNVPVTHVVQETPVAAE